MLPRAAIANLAGGQTYAALAGGDSTFHDKHQALLAENPGGYIYGEVMIGIPKISITLPAEIDSLAGAETNVTVDRVFLHHFGFMGLFCRQSCALTASRVEGVLPAPSASVSSYIDSVHGVLVSRIGPQVGYAFQIGMAQYGASASTDVTGSHFSGLGEGIVVSRNRGITSVRDSIFETILDHAVYLLSPTQNYRILQSRFLMSYFAAIKIGGHLEEPPSRPMLFQSELGRNEFVEPRTVALLLSGSYAYIHDNVSVSDPARPFPDFRVTTYGGQSGWSNHCIGNRIENNRAVILLEQFVDSKDKSVAGNSFAGVTQQVYFHTKVNSQYPPDITVADSPLTIGAPPNCPTCYPNAPGYRKNPGSL